MGKIVKLYFIYFSCIAWLSSTACNSISLKGKNASVQASHEMVGQKSVSVNSNINLSNRYSREGQIRSLNTKESLIDIQMINAHTGWILTDRGTLFNTTDEGKTWKIIKVEESFSGVITSASFVSKDIGWVSIVKTPADVLDDTGFESSLLATNDGGLHWSLQYISKAVELKRVLFVGEQEGWAVGSRLVRRESLENDYIILYTVDGGKHWKDVSGSLNQDIEGGRVEDIYAVENHRILILTSSRRIFSTLDGGETWQLIGEIKNEPPQTSMFKIGMLNNQLLWVLGGTGGREGTWTMLAVRQGDETYLKYKIPGVIISDIRFLSNKRLIACGTTLSSSSSTQVGEGDRAGVVIYSLDGGANWSVAYMTKQVQNLNALSIADSEIYWVLGENGFLIQQHLPTR
jgi:photosystem II stability/assembly factor-like uncharacterized protein